MAARSLIRYKQVRRTEKVDSLADETLYVLGRYWQADCLTTDTIGHCVYVTGPSVASIPQVTRVDPKTTGLIKPAVGIIVEKTTTTRCLVMSFGEVAVSPAVLVPGVPYWVGADGKPTEILPIPDPGGKIACQIIGTAIDTGRLLINPERRPCIRTS